MFLVLVFIGLAENGVFKSLEHRLFLFRGTCSPYLLFPYSFIRSISTILVDKGKSED